MSDLGIPKQSVRFALVGMLNTAVDFSVFWSLVRWAHWSAAAAQVVSYTCGVCNSYLWNRRVTFQRRGHSWPAEASRFGALSLATALLSALGIHVLGRMVRPVILPKLAVTAIATGLNFAGSKWWVFRDHRPRVGARRRNPRPPVPRNAAGRRK